jgi:hypothetical protein
MMRPSYLSTLNPGSIQARGLIGWWPVHSPSMLHDLSGRGQHASTVFTNGMLLLSEVGYGLDFSNDKHCTLGGDTLYTFGTGDFSLTAWIDTTSVIGNIVTLGKFDGAGDDYWIGFSNGVPAFVIRSTAILVAGTANDGWGHLLIGTRLAGTAYLYVDGVEVQSVADSSPASPGGPLEMGQFGSFGGSVYDGRVYEARVYDRGISAAEARAMWAPQTRWELYETPKRRSRRGAAVAAGVSTIYALKPGTAAPGTVWRLQPT